MSNPLQFSVDIGRRNPDHRARGGEPLRLLLLTDLGESCRSRADMPIETRPMRLMDVDRFEDLLHDEHPELSLASGALRFREIDDFHPDQICRALPAIQKLKELRSRVKVPATFETAAQEVRAMLRTDPAGESAAAEEDDSATLSRLFGQPDAGGAGAPPPAPPNDFLGALLHEAVAAHVTADADPRAEHYVAALDDALAAHLRAVLHDPAFQSLEAAWRGLDFLVSQIETDEDLSIHIWNISKPEALDALGDPDLPPDRSALHRRIVEDHQEHPFTLILTDFTFGTSADDIRLLATLGAIAGRTDALVLAPVAAAMIGAESWSAMAAAPESASEAEAGWDALRATPMAQHITALGPRFLLRSPYGKRTDPIDAFAFEELDRPADPAAPFLWGAPSLVAAALIARSFRSDGWAAQVNRTLDFDDLPLVPFEADGTSQIKPCAEALFPDRAAEAVLKAGPVPVMGIRNRNGVRLPWFQTISTARQTGRVGPFTC